MNIKLPFHTGPIMLYYPDEQCGNHVLQSKEPVEKACPTYVL